MKRPLMIAALLAVASPALAQDEEQRVLMRGLIEALRANADVTQKNTAAMEALS